MARRTRPITVKEIEALARVPGRHSVGDGLLFVVQPSGTSSWLARVRDPSSKRRDIGLGRYPETSLGEAREKAAEHIKAARGGIDPVALKREKERRGQTFREAAEAVHSEREEGYRNAVHRRQWIWSLREYAFPFIGSIPIEQVDGPSVVNLLKPIWTEKPETARRVLQRTAAVVAWAAAHGYRPHELPVRSIRMGLPPQPKKSDEARHHPAVAVEEAAAVFRKLIGGNGVARDCLKFLILTASRSAEARGAMWDEIDLDRATWTIPATRMKAGEKHVVALSTQAVALLKSQVRVAPNEAFVFPGIREGKPIVDASVSKSLRAVEAVGTVHGWRSTFRDWAAERTDFRGEIAEAALAHTVRNKVEAAYKRTKFLDLRRDLMQRWADFLEGQVDAPQK